MLARSSRRRLAAIALGTVALTATALAVPSAAAAAPSTASGALHLPHVVPVSSGHRIGPDIATAGPPTTADCQAELGINCYSPLQLEQAYNLPALFNTNIRGAGKTIAVVDSFGSPTIAADLATFDAAFGLPAPPSIRTITPAGKLPPFDPTNDDMTGWAFETTLDVEYAHAMAPDASILVVATPVSETEGVTGLPQMMQAENYVINHHLADVISQSFGATENTFPSKASILNLRGAFKNAAAHHVTVLAAAGDDGATDAELDGTTLYPYRVQSWPSADPLVTSVGGTELSLDAKGNRTSPDVVWNDGYGAGGGGVSEYFPRPVFQDGQRAVVGNARGVPDVSMSAAVNGGAIVYVGYDAADKGFQIVGGTSESTPIFAGIVALADQVAGKDLGNINTPLYQIAGQTRSGVVDVTSGNNTFAGVTGYRAKKGYDLASGIGTINASTFVPALAAQAGGSTIEADPGDRT